MRKNKILSLIICFIFIMTSVVTFVSPSKVEAANPPLRRVISSENPMFLYNIYKGSQGPQNIEALWNALPTDLRPYFAIQIKPDSGLENTPSNINWINSMLDKAQELGIPTFIQAETMNTDSNIPYSYYSSLFDNYSVMTGMVFAELSASGITVLGITAAQIANIKEAIDTVSAKGGYFMWQDMGYEIEHLFTKAGADAGLYQKITQNKDNVILIDKHNGRSKRFVGPSAAMGFWTSDLVGNWGVNSEDWMWWEAGFSQLYSPAGANRSSNDWKAVFTFPDSQFGIDWMADMAGGATVFALECPYHGFTSMESDLLTPAMEKVLIPMMRKMVNGIIPSKQQVMDKIKVAHQVNSGNPNELQNDEFAVDLYGPEGTSSLSEWIPSTGRYAYLPIIPALAGATERSKFEGVTNTGNYDGLFPTHYDKNKRFNQDYPATGSGDSWFMNYGNNHFIFNPNENKNITTTFEFPLATNPLASLAGSMSPHTLSIVQEKTDGLSIHLSNYRIDSNADVWNNPNFNTSDIAGYVRNKYISNPSDNTLRQSVVVIKGATSSEPPITVTGDNGYTYTTSWNNELKELTITVNHNGPVDIEVQSALNGAGTTNRNIATFSKVTSSSRESDYNSDEKAIDGVASTRWNASANDKVGSWLEMNFDTNVTFNKVVLKEYLDRVTGYKLQYWNGISWSDILSDTTIGATKVNTFTPVTTNKLRVYFTATKTDSNGWGAEPSISEVEVFNTLAPTAVPKPGVNLALNKTATASSFYNSDPARAASKAFDGTSMSSWNAGKGTSGGQWLEVNLGQPTTFNKIITKSMLDRITGYKLQYWDGTKWNDILFGSKTYPQKCDTFAPVTAQRVRIYINSTKNDQVGWGADAEIEEFEIYYDQSIASVPANLALNKTATASSNWNNDATRPSWGIDANLSTSWNATKNTSTGQWFEVNLGQPTAFNRIDIYAYLDRINGYKLQYLNGSTWVDILTGTTIAPYKSSTFNTVTAQKVRVYVTSCKTDQNGWGIDPEIDELAIYMQ